MPKGAGRQQLWNKYIGKGSLGLGEQLEQPARGTKGVAGGVWGDSRAMPSTQKWASEIPTIQEIYRNTDLRNFFLKKIM